MTPFYLVVLFFGRAIAIVLALVVIALAGCDVDEAKRGPLVAIVVMAATVGGVILWDVVRYVSADAPPPAPDPEHGARVAKWLAERRIDKPDDDDGTTYE